MQTFVHICKRKIFAHKNSFKRIQNFGVLPPAGLIELLPRVPTQIEPGVGRQSVGARSHCAPHHCAHIQSGPDRIKFTYLRSSPTILLLKSLESPQQNMRVRTIDASQNNIQYIVYYTERALEFHSSNSMCNIPSVFDSLLFLRIVPLIMQQRMLKRDFLTEECFYLLESASASLNLKFYFLKYFYRTKYLSEGFRFISGFSFKFWYAFLINNTIRISHPFQKHCFSSVLLTVHTTQWFHI